MASTYRIGHEGKATSRSEPGKVLYYVLVQAQHENVETRVILLASSECEDNGGHSVETQSGRLGDQVLAAAADDWREPTRGASVGWHRGRS